MAGYSLGGADLLRRAMGKKIQEAMDAERPKFIAGAAENGVDAKTAEEVWALLDKFANYGFNKSHAAAYGLVSYQTAWLKANHPVEYMAAVMNADIHLTDKLNVYKREVERLGIGLVPPCVNRSDAVFSVAEGRIVYALGAIKNVGGEAMRLLVAARGEAPFRTLFDLARRVDLRLIGKRALEMLARAGAFDALDTNRARVFAGLDALIAHSAACMTSAPRRRCRCSARQRRICRTRGCPIPHPGCQQKSWPRNMPRSASTCRAIRWKTIAGRLPARGSRR
jgi:DNA polymerase-3 subunit alpha